MKTLAANLAVLTAVTLISAVQVVAGEGMGTSVNERTQKDECLLVSQSCRNSVDSIQQRIDRLNREISKGESAYSRDELRHLEFQLKDATRTLETLQSPDA